MSKDKSGKSKKPNWLRRILLTLVGLVIALVLYLLIGYWWMGFSAGRANLTAWSSPHTETIQGSGQGILKVTVLGDSTAIGIGTSTRQQTFSYQVIRASLLAKYGSVNYINRAVSGAKVQEVIDNQLPAALQDQPDLVFISIGANDATGGTTPDKYQASLRSLLDRLTQETQAKVVLLGIPSVYAAPVLLPLFPQIIDIFTHRLIDVENKLLLAYPAGRVLPVELYNSTGPVFDRQPELFAADGYHPNEQGYTVWAKEVEKVLD